MTIPLLVDTGVRQIRYASRRLLKTPVFVIVAVLLLALGIGSTVASLSLIDAVIARSLPVAVPDDLVVLSRWKGEHHLSWSYPLLQDLAAHQRVFTHISGTADLPDPAIRLAGRHVTGARVRVVTDGYFDLFGVDALRGHRWTASELLADPLRRSVVVLGHRFWTQQAGADPEAIGRGLLINREAFTIIGVMPPSFLGETPGSAVDVWVPIERLPALVPGRADWLQARNHGWLSVMARLAPGASAGQAQSALTTLLPRVMQQGDRMEPGEQGSLDAYRIEVRSGARGLETVRHALGPPLSLVMWMMVLVLFLVCANVAASLVARTIERRRELDLAAALGASRAQLTGEVIVEGLLLAALGGAAGWLVAWAVAALLVRSVSWATASLFVSPPLSGWRMGFLALLASLIAASVCAAICLVQRAPLSRMGADVLSGATTAAQSRRRVAHIVLILQIAICVMLWAGTGAFLNHLRRLDGVDLGLRHDGLVTFGLDAESGVQRSRDEWVQLRERLEARVVQVPGIAAIALSQCGLQTSCTSNVALRVEGWPHDPSSPETVRSLQVSTSYVDTMGMRVVSGRTFNDRDRLDAPRVALINESMARYYFPGQRATGKRLAYAGQPLDPRRPFPIEIVGVVRDVAYDDVRQAPVKMLFLPLSQEPDVLRSLDVRPTAPGIDVDEAIRRAIDEVDPRVVIASVSTVEQRVAQSLVPERMIARLGLFFSVLGLVLIAAGLYGSMTQAVLARSREIGIRLALGASPGIVRRTLLDDAIRTVAGGVGIGLPAGIAFGVVIRTLVRDARLADLLLALPAALLVIIAVSLAASYIPARVAAGQAPAPLLKDR